MGFMLGATTAIIYVLGKPHVFALYDAARFDFQVRLVLVIAVSILAITLTLILESAVKTIVKLEKSFGALGYLLAVFPALALGYFHAMTLSNPTPMVADILAMANLKYEDGVHSRLLDPKEPNRAVGGFNSGQSQRLPQIQTAPE